MYFHSRKLDACSLCHLLRDHFDVSENLSFSENYSCLWQVNFPPLLREQKHAQIKFFLLMVGIPSRFQAGAGWTADLAFDVP
jgi:hypothetical protein